MIWKLGPKLSFSSFLMFQKYLMMQAAMGTDKFLAKYKDVSFGLVMKRMYSLDAITKT